MPDNERKPVDLGDIPAAVPDSTALSDQDADEIVGGLGVPYKSFIPAPPGPVPLPYPNTK